MLALWLALLPVSVPDACDLCRSDGDEVQLCGPHANVESRTLTEARVRLKYAKEPEERGQWLRAVAGLTREHENAPSPAVAELLASGLEDETPTVRTLAVGLLMEGQHGPTVAAALVTATHDLRDYLRIDPLEDVEWPEMPKASKKDGKDDLQRQLEALKTVTEALGRQREALEAFQSYPRALAAALARADTPGTRGALLEWERPWDPEISRAVLSLGTRRALTNAVTHLVQADESVARSRTEVEALDGPRPPRPPRTWKGTPDQWVVSRKRGLASAEENLVELEQALLAFGEERHLEAPDATIASFSERWKAWLAIHGPHFPE